jgi:hypothetical protein
MPLNHWDRRILINILIYFDTKRYLLYNSAKGNKTISKTENLNYGEGFCINIITSPRHLLNQTISALKLKN